MFQHYDELGFFNPYYTMRNNRFVIHTDFRNMVEVVGTCRLDGAALVEIFNTNHCFADRTPVEGIDRTPWMARPNASNDGWEYADVPSHGHTNVDTETIAETLFRLLQEEMLEYIGDRKTVGVLLSGGMDSRMVAGTLDHLISTRQLSGVTVVALTWGNENSRDVVYAGELAKRLGWEWKHWTISADNLFDNIDETAKRGCEYSPIHLHAMSKIRELGGLDCILAGSFGDSIGRAEYSGSNVTSLQPLDAGLGNRYHMLSRDIIGRYKAVCHEDLDRYHRLFPQPEPYQFFEQDQQLHYMRRLINACMGVMNEKIPVYQLFSKPSVFGYMWSLAPNRRNNLIYQQMLRLFPRPLYDIPWARTGLPFPDTGGVPDRFEKSHTFYGSLLNRDIFDTVKALVLSENVARLGVFNMDALESMMQLNRLFAKHEKTWLDERFLWIASLSRFAEIYPTEGIPGQKHTYGDLLEGKIKAPAELFYEKGKRLVKKFYR
jgi:asparagine synthase (glutamine-hydrolysing)